MVNRWERRCLFSLFSLLLLQSAHNATSNDRYHYPSLHCMSRSCKAIHALPECVRDERRIISIYCDRIDNEMLMQYNCFYCSKMSKGRFIQTLTNQSKNLFRNERQKIGKTYCSTTIHRLMRNLESQSDDRELCAIAENYQK